MATTKRVVLPDGGFEETASDMLSNIEVSLGAKGQVQYAVKLYLPFEDREAATREIKRLTDLLDEAYKGRLAGA